MGLAGHRSAGGEQLYCASLVFLSPFSFGFYPFPHLFFITVVIIVIVIVIIVIVVVLTFFILFKLLNCSYLNPRVLHSFQILLPTLLGGEGVSKRLCGYLLGLNHDRALIYLLIY